jgi:hypothetical protein
MNSQIGTLAALHPEPVGYGLHVPIINLDVVVGKKRKEKSLPLVRSELLLSCLKPVTLVNYRN